MSWSQAIVTYTLTWWVLLFCVLPLGVEPGRDQPPGSDPGAPHRPQMLRKVIITTVIATVVFAVIWAINAADIVSFRRMEEG